MLSLVRVSTYLNFPAVVVILAGAWPLLTAIAVPVPAKARTTTSAASACQTLRGLLNIRRSLPRGIAVASGNPALPLGPPWSNAQVILLIGANLLGADSPVNRSRVKRSPGPGRLATPAARRLRAPCSLDRPARWPGG